MRIHSGVSKYKDFRSGWPATFAVGLALILVGSVVSASRPLAAIPPTVKALQTDELGRELELIAGLRQRLLLDLADQWTDRQLQRFADNPTAQGELVIEQMKTQLTRAVLAPSAERATAWEKTRQIGQEFLLRFPAHPRRLLIQTQLTLTRMAEAKLVSQEYLLSPQDDRLQKQALEIFRTVRLELEGLQRDATQSLASANSGQSSRESLSADELRSLMANLKFQLASCNLQRAELFPTGDEANREDALLLVMASLDTIIASVDDSNDLWWTAQLSRVAALRLLGNTQQAQQALENLPLTKLPAVRTADFRQQQLELAALDDQPQKHLGLLPFFQQVSGPSPELEIAALRYLVRLSASNTPAPEVSWLDQAAQLTRRIELRHGQYWGRLAERILVGNVRASASADTSSSSGVPANAPWEVIVRVGDNAVRESRSDDAASAYRQAVQMLRSEAKTAEAWLNVFQVQLKLAEIFEGQRKFGQAAELLTEASRWQPDHPSASKLHLRAVWCWAQLATQSPADRERYREVLAQHLTWWPESDSANQARIWSARLAISDGQWLPALEAYAGVQPQCSLASTAAQEFGVAFAGYRDSLKKSTATEETRRLIEPWLIRLSELEQASGFRDAHTDNWVRRHWLLHRLSFGLELGLIEAGKVAEELQTAMGVVLADSPETWQFSAQAILIAAQSLSGTSVSNQQTGLNAIAANSTAVAAIWRVLSAPAHRDQKQTRPLRYWALEQLIRLSPEANQSGWQLELLDLQLADEQFEAAEVLAASLLDKRPQSLDARQRLARALQGQAPKISQALAQWRRIAAGAPEQTESWFEAKYEVARLLLETGQKAQARQMLEYLSAIPPGWTKSQRRQAFEALLKKCQQ